MGTASNEGGMMSNNASVSATEADIEPENNQMSQEMPITPMADLSLMIHEQREQTSGDTYLLTYTININNAGPSTANQINIVSELPNGVTITKMEGKGWQINEKQTDQGVRITSNTDTLPTGSAPDITIGLRVPSDMTVEHRASVNADTIDDNMENNQASKISRPFTKLYLPIVMR